jgi:sarcosine oxidase / L-pipecolate oxidase
MGVSKHEHILIVGAGAFGLSTALHLSQNGYSNITVLEQDDEVPSRYSAANDLNKIMRVEYEDPWYTDLTLVSKTASSSLGATASEATCPAAFPC